MPRATKNSKPNFSENEAPRSAAFRIAIVGHGLVAQIHASAIGAIPDVELVAVAGRDVKRAEPFAAEHGIAAFSDVEAMVQSVDADAVIVATPHPTHTDIAIIAAKAGAHVLIEKPLATTVADCDRIIEAANTAGVTLAVVSQRRLLPAVQRVKTAIDRGSIGKPILGSVATFSWRGPDYYEMDDWRGTWKGEGGGILVNQAVHHLDLILWLMGPFDEVFGYWANLNHPDIEVDDTAVAVLRGSDGRLASIVASNSQNPGLYARILVNGENGATVGVQTDGGSMFIAGESGMQETPCNHVWTIPGEEHHPDTWRREDEAAFSTRDPILYFHELVIGDFVEAAQSGRPPAVSGQDGRRAVELFEAIYRSNESGSPIRLSPSP